MKPSEIIYQLREVNDAWRKQDFVFTKEQQATYDRLTTLRRERVRELYAEDRVCKVSKSAQDKLRDAEDN